MSHWDFIDDALQRAEASAPPIRLTANLHSARVLSVDRIAEARLLFTNAVAALDRLAVRPSDLDALQREALMLGAAIDPDFIPQLLPLSDRMSIHAELELFRTLISHNHFQAAFYRLLTFEPASGFPYAAVSLVLQHCSDEDQKLLLIRRAIHVWRQSLLVSPPSLPRRP